MEDSLTFSFPGSQWTQGKFNWGKNKAARAVGSQSTQEGLCRDSGLGGRPCSRLQKEGWSLEGDGGLEKGPPNDRDFG